jgi:hypothetical protein
MTTPTYQSIQLSSNNSTYNFKSDLVKISDGLFTFNLSLKDGKILLFLCVMMGILMLL